MIIKCPECDTGFVVPPESLAPSGRKVKCSNCQTQWFQKYPIDEDDADNAVDKSDDAADSTHGQATNPDGEADDKGFAEHMDDQVDVDDAEDVAQEGQGNDDATDIPDSVKPQKDDLSDVNVPSMVSFSPVMRRVINYSAVGVGFVLILTGFILGGDSVTSFWPDSRGFYNRLGYEYKVPGEHVEFDRVSMNTHFVGESHNGGSDRWELQLSGYLINSSASPVDLPLVKLDILDANHYKLVTHIVPMTQNALDGGAVLPFSQNFAGEDVLLEAKHFTLYFDKPEAYRYGADIEQPGDEHNYEDQHDDSHTQKSDSHIKVKGDGHQAAPAHH